VRTRERVLSAGLIGLTFLSTLYVGAGWAGKKVSGVEDLRYGLPFGLSLMAILLAHEFGHFFAARRHGVSVSLPYFLPAPIFLFGTLGAVIRIRDPIRSRNALLDIGASGPIAGLLVAVPVLIVGLVHSPIRLLQPLEEGQVMLVEGKSILYALFIYLIKGPIPPSSDVMLHPIALAGWVGLLVTMINLLPVGQLDGGHIAYSLLGPRQNAISRWVRHSLPILALGVGSYYSFSAWQKTKNLDESLGQMMTGLHWLVWWVVLLLMPKEKGEEHPPAAAEPLSPWRTRVGYACLALFLLLFMPSWLRQT